MTNLVPRVFVDFDGTISRKDVGNSFFRKFGNEVESLKAVKLWMNGELSGRDLTLKEAEYVKVSREDALSYTESFEIDPEFKGFLSFCKANGIEITVLSDGLDFYIIKKYKANEITDVAFYSNLVHFESGGIRIEFPYESDCTKCGNCKGYQILKRTGIDDVIVYIGNGFSDRCAVQYADMVFAKDELLKYCEENNVTYFPFDNFGDVLSKFEKVFASKSFRKRNRAELRRKEAYLAE